MIIDKSENFDKYHFDKAWKMAFEFLSQLTPDSKDGRYAIQGEDVFAIVMSYETVSPNAAILEAHRDYVDVQTVILGVERFECFYTDELEVKTPYDKSKDVEFYKRIAPGYVGVDVTPGTFVALYPHDAHMAGLMVGDKQGLVKKAVVKIKKELLDKIRTKKAINE